MAAAFPSCPLARAACNASRLGGFSSIAMGRWRGFACRMSFDALGLSDALALQLDQLGYAAPTPIQRAAIPLILSGGDLLAAAQTGSGKTAAFALPILHRLAVADGNAAGAGARAAPRALVLVPTRELAAQVGASFARYGRALPLPPRA